jgi:hypothetical protein
MKEHKCLLQGQKNHFNSAFMQAQLHQALTLAFSCSGWISMTNFLTSIASDFIGISASFTFAT